MSRGKGQRALGRLGSFVIAGVVVSAIVAAIAFAASSRSNGAKASPNTAPFGHVQLGTTGVEFPMLAYSWGVSNSGSTQVGGGGGAGKANVQDISITKSQDVNTVELLKKVTTGAHYATAVVTTTDPATSATLEYDLQDVLVTSDSLGGSVGSSGPNASSPTENFSLDFARVTWTYTDAAGHSTSGSFNTATNTP